MYIGNSTRWILLAAILAALSAVTLGGLAQQDWAYDDEDYMRSARHEGGGFLYLLSPDKEGLEFDYNAARPVVHLYFRLLYPFLGENPGAYHIANVVVHTLNGLILSVLVFAWSHRFLPAGLSGVLFLTSLGYFRAVYWVSGIGILLGTLLGLASVLAMILHLRTRRPSWWALSFIFILIAPFAHEASVVFVGLLAFLCVRSEGARKGLARVAPHAAVLVIAFAAGRFVYNTPISRESDFRIGLHAARNLPVMIYNLFSPVFAGEYYDARSYPLSLAARIAAGTALLAGLLLAARRVPLLRPAALGLILFLLPYLLFAEGYLAWRYHYLAAAAAAVFTAAGIVWLGRRIAGPLRWRAGRTAVPVLLAGGLAGIAHPQVGFLMAIQHSFSGLYLSREGRHERALIQYERADARAGGHPAAHHWRYNEAITLLALGRIEDGYRLLLEIVGRHPEYERGREVLLQAFAKRQGLDAPRVGPDGSILYPKRIVDRLKEEALAASRDGRREEARALAAAYRHSFPRDPELERLLRDRPDGAE